MTVTNCLTELERSFCQSLNLSTAGFNLVPDCSPSIFYNLYIFMYTIYPNIAGDYWVYLAYTNILEFLLPTSTPYTI